MLLLIAFLSVYCTKEIIPPYSLRMILLKPKFYATKLPAHSCKGAGSDYTVEVRCTWLGLDVCEKFPLERVVKAPKLSGVSYVLGALQVQRYFVRKLLFCRQTFMWEKYTLRKGWLNSNIHRIIQSFLKETHTCLLRLNSRVWTRTSSSRCCFCASMACFSDNNRSSSSSIFFQNCTHNQNSGKSGQGEKNTISTQMLLK